MGLDPYHYAWYHVHFENACARKTGREFQNFFECIMDKADSSFQPIGTWGREGDWGCDGISLRTNTYFAVYAPERGLTSKQVIAKLTHDWERAYSCWGERMQHWCFVANGKVPPPVMDTFNGLRENHPSVIFEDPWGEEELWKLVNGLPLQDIQDLLGPLPLPLSADIPAQVTAAEVEVLLSYLCRNVNDHIRITDSMEYMGLLEKIKRNKLDSSTEHLIRTSVGIANIAQLYLEQNPDPGFVKEVARVLSDHYTQFVKTTDDPNRIFGRLVEAVLTGHEFEPKMYYAAAGIITYFFELCDIFEK